MDSLFILWWIGTTTMTAALLVNLPGKLAWITSPRRFTVMILLTAVWVMVAYAIGKATDRFTERKFSDGYPPFHASVYAVIWFVAFVAGMFIVPIEAASSLDAKTPTLDRIEYVGAWTVGWLVLNATIAFLWRRKGRIQP